MPINANSLNSKRGMRPARNPPETSKAERRSTRPKKASDGANIGSIIRDGRVHLGWTQEILSGKSGVPVRTICNIESGRTSKPATVRELLDTINPERRKRNLPELLWPEENAINPLDASTSHHLGHKYDAFVREGLYDDAGELAENALKEAEAAHDQRLLAHWAKCAAAAYRCRGMLREASAFYAMAWGHTQRALKETPADEELRYQEGKIRFGQIMVDAFLSRGAFEEAFKRHGELLKDASSLFGEVQSAQLKDEIKLRCTHIKRQQAEMLRLLGRYDAALQRISEVLCEYSPERDSEAHWYARVSKADSLRLKGESVEALTEYDRLLGIATRRNLHGLHGEVLWRKIGALQTAPTTQKNRDELARCSRDLKAIAEAHAERYRYVFIYSLLTSAAGRVSDPDQAQLALRRAEQFGGSSAILVTDVMGLESLARKLSLPMDTDKVSAYLTGQFSNATREALAKYQSAGFDRGALQQAMVKALNRIIRGPLVYDPQRFSGVRLRLETEQLRSQNPQGDSLPRLNRMLLEDAYPQELSGNKSGDISQDYLRTEYAHLALCRAEILRTNKNSGDAKKYFLTAFECYERMGMRWGVVRSWIGLKLTGGDKPFPSWCKRSLEGLDAVLLERFNANQGKMMPTGILSANIP
jgi:tetratricopeptide (TPR) repeat protein